MMTCASFVRMVANLCFVMAVQGPFTKVCRFINLLFILFFHLPVGLLPYCTACTVWTKFPLHMCFKFLREYYIFLIFVLYSHCISYIQLRKTKMSGLYIYLSSSQWITCYYMKEAALCFGLQEIHISVLPLKCE